MCLGIPGDNRQRGAAFIRVSRHSGEIAEIPNTRRITTRVRFFLPTFQAFSQPFLLVVFVMPAACYLCNIISVGIYDLHVSKRSTS